MARWASRASRSSGPRERAPHPVAVGLGDRHRRRVTGSRTNTDDTVHIRPVQPDDHIPTISPAPGLDSLPARDGDLMDILELNPPAI